MKSIEDYIRENIVTVGLIATLIIGIILRFKGLTFQSHWADELASAFFSMSDRSFWSMYDVASGDTNPPLYQILLWGWYQIFGFSEYAGRSLSAIIGSLGVFAVFLLGKTFFNKEVGLYAAVIASMNQFLIHYSQEVRSYSLFFLLSTISYVYLFKIMNDYNKKNFILYLFFTVALLYTHYFGFFLVATQVFVFIYYFIKDKEKRKLLAILASITSIVLIVFLLPQMDHLLSHNEIKSFWIKKPTEWFALDYMKKYVKSQYLEGIFFLMITISLMYLFRGVKYKTYKSATIVLLLWVTAGYLLPYIQSLTSMPLLIPRYTIMIIPPLILLVSYGIYLMNDVALKITTVGVIIFFSMYQLSHVNYYGKVTKQQWREVLFEVDKSKEEIPVFDIFFDPLVKNTYGYKTYSLLLNTNLDISDSKELNKQYNNGILPNCFFAVDSHGDHISKSKILQDKRITKVLEIKKHRARGVLYAYNISPQKCSELYNGILEDIDFTECNLSKPYKGNPLGMPWSGSITTPTYKLKNDNYNLIVNAKGTKAFDEYAKLKIQVFRTEENNNSLLVEKIVDTKPNFTKFIIPFGLSQDTNVSFIVSFINDKSRVEPKEDRNVYLKSIILKKQ